MRERLREFRLTPAGGLVSMMVIASVVVLLIGPRHDHNAAWVILLIAVAIVVAQGSGLHGRRRLSDRTLQDRRAEFHAQHRDPGEGASVDEAEQDRLWERERERYKAGG